MKIMYFTTSMRENDFAEFSKKWRISLNPSNQNFHNKVIRSLAITNKVDVFSLRPFSRMYCRLKRLNQEIIEEGNISWNYLKVVNFKLFRVMNAKKQLSKLLKGYDFKDTVIVTDTINPSVIKLANFVSKKYRVPIVGMCTDSPSNISGTSRSYSMFLFNQSKNLSGYITLTPGLNDLFNQLEKPHIILEGIVEDKLPNKIENKYGKFFFFGGALMPKYGVYELIKAFKSLNTTGVKLLICGHHGDNKKLIETIGATRDIIYLKTLPVKQVLQLEQNAIANINPRPFSEDLDRFSVPSKTIEYFSTGTLTISIKNTILEKEFDDSAIWVESNDVKELAKALQRALDMSDEEKEVITSLALKKVKKLYSLDAVNKKLIPFLESVIK